MVLPEEQEAISAVILAGGRGERLGGDKAQVVLGGETLLQRTLRAVSRLTSDVIVVVRDDQPLVVESARVVSDEPPHAGVLAGIAAGLSAAHHTWSLVVACDMPFLNLALLRYLLTLRSGCDVVVPRLAVGIEPLHALYHRRCLPAVRRSLSEGQRRVISFYGPLRVRYVATAEMEPFNAQGRSFFNINTPEDLRQAQAWLREGIVS